MTSALCRAALELGAVSGAFTPAAMADALGLEGDQRQRLWRDLSVHVAEVLDGDTYGWALTPDARVRQFRALVSRAGIDRLLEQAPAPWPGDDFGTALRRLLAGETIHLDLTRHREDDAGLLAEMREVGAMLEAAQFARHVAPLDGAALEALDTAAKRRIQELQRRRDLTLVLPHRHRGYDAERQHLSRFLRGQEGDARPVFLSGIGGAGKSALLARMFSYWQSRSGAPLTVVIDFDRRQLVSGEPVEILKEMLRQCATGIKHKLDDPKVAQAVHDGLQTLRRDLPELGPAAQERSFDSQIGYLDTVTLTALSQDWAAPLRDLPIAMMFDSFEAVDRRGGGTVELIFDLEAMLRERLPGLRTVVSGRAHPLDEVGMARFFGPPDRSVHLAGLAPRDGMALLADEDERQAETTGTRHLTEKAMRRRLTGALSGHPLALLMLVRFVHSRPDEVDALIRDLEADGGFQVEFAQTFLYERILDRIDKPDIRALAHPGLILRAVNDDLIRLVLDKPCLGREIDAAEAEMLRKDLEDEYWLVEPGHASFPLRHRPDLRQLMVPGLLAKPRMADSAGQRAAKTDLSAKARAICVAAKAWFRDGPPENDPAHHRWEALPDAVREAHVWYYRGLSGAQTIPDLTAEAARNIRQELGDDLDTMPPAWRAPVKVLVGIPVDEAELATLDGALRETAEAAIYEAEQATGRRRSVVPPKGQTVSTTVRDDTPSLAQIERAISTAFAGADFAQVASRADPYLVLLRNDQTARASRRFEKAMRAGLLHTAVWQLLLSVRVIEGEEEAVTFAEALHEIDPIHEWTTFLLGVGETEFYHPVDRLRWKRGRGIGAEEVAAICPAANLWIVRENLPKEVAGLRDLIHFSRDDTVTVSDLQRDIAAAREAMVKAPENLLPSNPVFIEAFRGLNPDLHAPLATCLRDAESQTVHTVLDELAVGGPLWPRELRFGDANPFNPRQAMTVVEIADELGQFEQLAALLGRTDPRAETVLRMYDLITDWFFSDLPLERDHTV
mgnify:CR=1 FL=1